MEKRSKPGIESESPQPRSRRPAGLLEPVAELALEELNAAQTPALSHLAPVDGMELLVEIAKLAGQVLESRVPAAKHSAPEPADPRRCIDPRKRVLPR